MRSMLSLALAAGLSLGSVAALAAESPVAAAFGNSIVSTYPDGRQGHLWLHENNTYDATGRRGLPSSGTWALKGEKLCLKQLKPSKAPFSYCTPIGAAKLGASWKGKAVTGEAITIRIVKGRG